MVMNGGLKMVAEFHKTFEHPILAPGEQEELSIRQLRIKLLFEELVELSEASDVKRTMYELCGGYIGKVMCAKSPGSNFERGQSQMALHLDEMEIHDGDNVDRLEELDALCDIRYVLDGKILTGGYHEVFDKNYEIVHKNNMTKAHNSREHAVETIAKIGEKTGEAQAWNIIEKEGKFLLFNEYGKLTKPHDHVKVKLEL